MFGMLFIPIKFSPMQKAKLLSLISSLCISSLSVFAQQVADTLYSPEISNPVYTRGNGPIILIDDAHSNFHTLRGGFRPFANVLEKDGYVVHSSSAPFTREQLSKGKILVIANAL